MRAIVFIFFILLNVDVFATQIVEWNKRPISVVLSVGKERIIQLPDNVVVGVPSSIQPLLRVQSAQGYVYLTALNGFSQSRIQLKMNKTGEIILVDISTTTEDVNQENIIIKLPVEADRSTSKKENSSPARKAATPIEQTRFASRTFYAPERLAISDHRIRMSKPPKVDLSDLFTGKSYDIFNAKALAVFKTGSMYLTAIKLVNKTPTQQTIVFQDINADFLYATPQHLQVNKKNVPGDTTMLYLITNKPLVASLYHPLNMNSLGE